MLVSKIFIGYEYNSHKINKKFYIILRWVIYLSIGEKY